MFAEFLKSPPISGRYPEVLFNANSGGTWAKFMDENYEEWCGAFAPGVCGLSGIISGNSEDIVFLVTDGQGYWVDLNRRTTIGETECDFVQDAVWPAGRDFVAICTFKEVLLVSPIGTEWTSHNIALDEIRFTSSDRRFIDGEADWTFKHRNEFKLDLDSRQFIGDTMTW